jgi:dTDP-4-dehydrorhamnose reductase
MRIVITGAAGMLGADVAVIAATRGHDVVALGRAELDITDPAAVGSAVSGCDVAINCAAWTDVDGAESAFEQALAVNRAGAGAVAGAASRAGAWMIQISTDYVFDGAKRTPYVESDPVGPLSAYGRSKLAGEQAVASAAPHEHTIVRSSWLFGAGGPCFPKTIQRLAAERDELTVVDDQVGCPTFTGHLAEALVSLCGERVPGVLHIAAEGECSWYEFAQAIVARTASTCEVKPGSTAELGRPAPRPAYSVLRSERVGAPALPDWRDGLEAFMGARV